MKKIMKKALSLMLALVMVFSLAPMTAMAATGDVDTPATLPSVDGSTIATTLNDTYTSYYYQWTATAGGVLTVAFEDGASWGLEIINTTTGTTVKQTSSYDTAGPVAVAVEQGMVYLIGVQEISGGTTLNFSATLEEGAVLPGSTPDSAIELTAATSSVTVEAMATTYYKYDGNNTAYTVEFAHAYGRASFVVYTKHAMTGMYSVENAINPSGTIDFTADEDGAIIFAIADTSGWALPVNINVTATGDEIEDAGEENPSASTNAYDNPEVLTALGTFNPATPNGGSYWYQWTAIDDGVLTITTTTTDGYTGVFTVNGEWEYVSESVENGTAVMLEEEDVVVFYVNPAGNTTANMTASFEPGATIETDDDLGGEEESNYEWGDAIVVGDNELSGPSSYLYTYTVHEFAPEEVGKYTFTTTDSLIGIVSNNGSWITVKLPDATELDQNTVPYTAVTEQEIVWECTDANQSIWIAVLPNENSANVKVVREDLVIETIEKEDWTLFVSPETYVFDGDEKDLVQLIYGMADGEVMYVMDDNGYFHVAPIEDLIDDENALFGYSYDGDKKVEELPYVLVDLSDKVVSLEAALAERDFLVATYDEEGEATGLINFTPALKEILACADEETGLYPLTFDLYVVFTEGGEAQGWYMNTESTTGIVAAEYPESDGIDPVFLHAFAMYYLDQDITTLDKEEPVVEKDAMADIIASNKEKDTVINTVTTNAAGEEVTIKFEFAAGSMKPVEGVEKYSFKVELVEDYSKATADKAEIEKDDFVLRINFEYDGQLPAKATISIPVGTAYANKTLYYYQILADGTLEYVCDAPVDAAGNAKVTQDHCSDYVLLAEKLVEETPDTIAPGGTTTGDATNIALWVAILGLGVVAIAGSVVMKKREF